MQVLPCEDSTENFTDIGLGATRLSSWIALTLSFSDEDIVLVKKYEKKKFGFLKRRF